MKDLKTKFQHLLKELFQFDLADLDFGIYRILNHKRQVIERWLSEDLPRAIEEELHRYALAKQGLCEGSDEVFVNGDSYILGARSLNDLFKARLFGKEEVIE